MEPVTLAALITGSAMLGGSAMNAFGKKDSVSQQPMLTSQQDAAAGDLSGFGRTGLTPWGYDWKASYGGNLGNYSMSGLEGQGQNSLSSMMGMGNPAIFGAGTNELMKLLQTSAYDPNNDGGVYKGLTAGIDRNTQLAMDATKQASSYMGNLYSTNAARNLGDVAAQGGINKSNILAGLYQNFGNQKLAGASAAIGAGAQEQGLGLARIGASQQYGGLQRALSDTQAKDAYNAWLTFRNSQLAPLQASAQVLGSNGNFGVQNIPIESPWAKILQTTAATAGNYFGQQSANEQSDKWLAALTQGGAGSRPWSNRTYTDANYQYGK